MLAQLGQSQRQESTSATAATVRATDPQDWRNVANLGLWSYVLGEGRNTEVAAAIREASLKAADEIVTRTAGLGY